MIIDILYLIKIDNQDDLIGAIERLKYSIQSILNNSYKQIRICIADTSKISLLEYLQKNIQINFEYVHRYKSDDYNRSFNINFGVKTLIKSNFFFISDIDIIYPIDHIEKHIKYDGYKIIVPQVYRISQGLWSSDFDQLVGHGILGTEKSGGNCYCSKKIFQLIRGYDEEYIGFGAEDDDFYCRASKVCQILLPKNSNFDKKLNVAHLWHERFIKDWNKFEFYLNKNKDRFFRQEKLYAMGKLSPSAVNLKGWGL